MSPALTASAPGKLVIVGEYAVLESRTALASAVNRRATANLIPLKGGFNELHVVNSGTTTQFAVADTGQIDWRQQPGASGKVVEAVFAILQQRGLLPAVETTFRIELDSRNFYQQDSNSQVNKLGLGSSAAICVALTGLLLEYFGSESELSIFLEAHRYLQQGRGSGLDVATSYAGEVVAYNRGIKAVATPEINLLSWPVGLYVLPIWTGHAASTPAMLEKLVNFSDRKPDIYKDHMAELAAASDYAITQWQQGQPNTILASLRDFADRLQALDSAVQIGIWSASHQQLRSIADDHGVVYKPSGAGGGDCGLAFGVDKAAVDNLASEIESAGFYLPQLEMADSGLRIAGLG